MPPNIYALYYSSYSHKSPHNKQDYFIHYVTHIILFPIDPEKLQTFLLFMFMFMFTYYLSLRHSQITHMTRSSANNFLDWYVVNFHIQTIN